MRHHATGFRIRERRRALGVKQNALAAQVGISAAYLNLIESNKRGVGGALLGAIGAELGLTIDQLDGTAERRLLEALEEMAADPELSSSSGHSGAAIEAAPGATEAFVARYPGWARLAARLHRKWRDAEAAAEAMSDRLSHDPALSAAVHAMLTEIAALRSTSEILAETERPDRPAIDPAQRRRFEEIMFEQSSRLAETGAALAAYFEKTAETRRRRTPDIDAEEALEAVDRLDQRIEGLAVDARRRMEERAPHVYSGDLTALLEVTATRPPETPAEAGWLERRDALALIFAEEACEEAFSEIVAEGRRTIAEAAADVTIEAESDEPASTPDPAPETEAAMTAELARRFADALILPADRILPIGRKLGWDVEAMGRAADGDVGLAMRRIACLSGLGAPRAAHLTVDASGRITGRRGNLSLVPRARLVDCPVWPVHRAPPGGLTAAALRDPEDARSLAVAWGRPCGMRGEMLVFDRTEAAATVYAATAAGRPEDVGAECRICAHAACRWRREPSILDG